MNIYNAMFSSHSEMQTDKRLYLLSVNSLIVTIISIDCRMLSLTWRTFVSREITQMLGLHMTNDIALLDGLKPTSLLRLAMKEDWTFPNIQLYSFIPL